jgi:SpoVK/Ycf46/Vps4 family AAA+-type ATPase
LAELPEITVAETVAELDNMVALMPVKEQIRQIAASVEATRRRAMAGYKVDKPMRHFVFLGGPGTGKTTVAQIFAKIFYAFGLLDMPTLIQAHRSDLVGDYLGETAVRTNELVDTAMGGVLFLNRAYSLTDEGGGQGSRFGAEAVQVLLKRARDDWENLVIILAGQERQMETFLASTPGLAALFTTTIKFASYTPAELLAMAEVLVENRGDIMDVTARLALWQMLDDVGRHGLVDELGNGRFIHSLVQKAGQARDVRLMSGDSGPGAADLVTIRAGDLQHAFSELTAALRGYKDTPTLQGAVAELDELIGLEQVKQQVRTIVTRLRVAKPRDQRGLRSQPAKEHLVFIGPPGTGKTTIARALSRVLAGSGVLIRPEVIEAQRADLIGENPVATAMKMNKIIDSAFGGMLFVDAASLLQNVGSSNGGAFSPEAVQTLMKRAEADRDRLVIVLAGHPAAIRRLLPGKLGQASVFSTRIQFPSYSASELSSIAMLLARREEDAFDPAAARILPVIFSHACQAGRIDQLGNGWFARALLNRARAHRDLRIVQIGDAATVDDLTTLTAADLSAAYQDLADLRAAAAAAPWRPVIARTSSGQSWSW